VTGGLLVVTAVDLEARALQPALPAATVAAVGAGPAAAAAGTARLLALAEADGEPYRAVVSAGVGGGFAGRADVGATVLASHSVAADLGAESPEGFIPLDVLGFGATTAAADPALLADLRSRLPAAVVGAVLTVTTVTGTADSARALAVRHPEAVAEAMEGYGVACAALGAGVPFLEIRTISNSIGPRDRAAWRLPDALEALSKAAAALAEISAVRPGR
jgi:futalosine hydrolase